MQFDWWKKIFPLMLTASVSHCEPGFSEGLLYLTPILTVLQFPLDGYKHHKIPQTTHKPFAYQLI